MALTVLRCRRRSFQMKVYDWWLTATLGSVLYRYTLVVSNRDIPGHHCRQQVAISPSWMDLNVLYAFKEACAGPYLSRPPAAP